MRALYVSLSLRHNNSNSSNNNNSNHHNHNHKYAANNSGYTRPHSKSARIYSRVKHLHFGVLLIPLFAANRVHSWFTAVFYY